MAHVIVDPRRCEGAKDCIDACPERVFSMRRPSADLPLLVRMKVAVHGGKQAFAAREAACTACLRCVDACPERAIAVVA